MDPIFALAISLGFFSLVIALVAISYRQTDAAREATKNLGELAGRTNSDQEDKENT